MFMVMGMLRESAPSTLYHKRFINSDEALADKGRLFWCKADLIIREKVEDVRDKAWVGNVLHYWDVKFTKEKEKWQEVRMRKQAEVT